jgi:hypothetical protein
MLRPFVVTATHSGKEDLADLDPEVREIFTKSDLSKDPNRLNVFMFVLDPRGRVVHEFHGVPGARRSAGSGRSDHEAELQKARAKLKLPEVKPQKADEPPEIDGAVNAFLQSQYPDYQTEDGRLHRTGHGIGLGNHEAPWVAEGSEDRLAENMVISVEPGIYIPGLGGVRHSDTVLITGTGYEPLTRLPTGPSALTIRGWRPFARAKGWLLRRALRLAGRAGRSERRG